MEDCSSDGRFICLLNGFFDEEYEEGNNGACNVKQDDDNNYDENRDQTEAKVSSNF